MRSTFSGLEIGRRAIQSQQKALDVTGHNIANANTEGYTRQRAILQATEPFAYPSFNKPLSPGQVGTGVSVQEIKRVRDSFVDSQIRKENTTTGEWSYRKDILQRLETIINEPSDSGLRTAFDAFWGSVQTLATRPEDRSVRANVRQLGIELSDTFNHMDKQLGDLQISIDQSLGLKVEEVNTISKQVADLNSRITMVEGLGDNANDLRDRRDVLIDQLSQLAKIGVDEDSTGAVTVTIGGRTLVGPNSYHSIAAVGTPPAGFKSIQWADGSAVNLSSGTLSGMVYSRDVAVTNQRTQLNALAGQFISKFNTQHQLGFGLNSDTYVTGVMGVQASLTANRTPTSAVPPSLDFTVPLDLTIAVDGNPAQTVSISGVFADVSALATFINNGPPPLAGATASDDGTGKLKITSNQATTALVTSSISVSGPAAPILFGFGVPFFSGTDASDMQVNAAISDLDLIAAAGGPMPGAPGRGDNALLLAGLKHDTTAMGTATFDDYYRGMAAQLGVDTQAADKMVTNQELLLSHLDNQKQQVSGVSLDEEMVNMMKYQHAYNAASRVVNTMDEMLEVIVNRLGLGGR